MSKIFIYSDLYLPTQPYLELPLYNYLVENGQEVVYILEKGDIRLTDSKLKPIYENLNLEVVLKPKTIPSMLQKGDLYVSRFAYKFKAGDVAVKVRAKGHQILQYDPSGIDIRVRLCPAHHLTAKSENIRKAVIKKFGRRKYKNIFVTGTIHNDAAATTQVDKKEFMLSYGLNPDKKLLILTPANPGEAWMEGLKETYQKIISIVRSNPNYELAIKCHPFDYTAEMKQQPGIIHKSQHYNGKPSWKELDPNLTVIKAEEGYKALKACDAILNVRSSIAMETALFRKPLININRSKYVTNWPFDEGVMMDIELEDLAFVLNTGNYNTDEEACEKYIKRECYSDDGLAYQRTAHVAIKILNGEV